MQNSLTDRTMSFYRRGAWKAGARLGREYETAISSPGFLPIGRDVAYLCSTSFQYFSRC